MLIVALILAGLAALLHVYIFWLESLRWTSPKTRAIFGTTAAQAESSKQLAYNQGFYNLFLAIITGIGIAVPNRTVGDSLVFVGTGSMLAAALVLVTADRTKVRASVIQGLIPLLAIVALVIAQI